MSENMDYTANLPDGTQALIETESNEDVANRLGMYKSQYKLISEELQSKEYILMNGDTETLYIDFKNRNIRVLDNDFLPIPLKDYLKNSDWSDHIKASGDFDVLRDYLSARVLSLSRTNAKAILNSVGFSQSSKLEERLKISVACRCVTFQDNIWLKKKGEHIAFKDVNLRENSLANKSYEIAILGKTISATTDELRPDLTSLGMFPKYWQRRNNKVYLLKTDNTKDFINTVSEVTVSNILQKAQANAIRYSLEERDGRLFAVCECFCTNDYSFLSAQDMVDHCVRTGQSFLDYMKANWLTEFSNMVVIDYVLANTDRHMENFGFMADNYTNQVVSMAPLYDHNQALVADYFGTNIDDLYYAPTGQMFIEAAEQYYKTSDVVFPENELPVQALNRLNRLKTTDRINEGFNKEK